MSFIKAAKRFLVMYTAICINQGCRRNENIGSTEIDDNVLKIEESHSISEAYLKRNEIDQRSVRLHGFLHSVNGHLYLMESPDSKIKIDIPEYPFLLEDKSWSREVVITGKYQLSGNLSSDIVSPISKIEISNPNNIR